jgi:hypothetical protein
MTKIYKSVKLWSLYLFSLCLKTKAKFKVFCIKYNNDCVNKEKDWQKRVIKKRLHGSLSAFFTRVKHKYRLFIDHKSLIRLLTVCIECCTKLDLYYKVD